MNHYRYLLAGLFLAVSCALAQQQADNLSGFSQVCLFTQVLNDGERDAGREEAVLTHMHGLATELGLPVQQADVCQSLAFDLASDTLKILLTLELHTLPEGGYAYSYTLFGLLDMLEGFSSVSIYQSMDFGISSETEQESILNQLVHNALRSLAADWQSTLSAINRPTGETSQRREGPTPNGGTYSIAYFRDENGNPTTKDQARIVEIIEYNAKGEVIHSTIGYINP